MDEAKLRALLDEVSAGTLEVAAAVESLRRLPFADLGYARVDHHRALRQGLPEVVFGLGKTAEHVSGVVAELARAGQNVLVTRLDPSVAERVAAEFPQLSYNAVARTAALVVRPVAPRSVEPVLVVTAGTSDLPVAEEAIETLTLAGIPFLRVYDAGVAGLHRILSELHLLERASAAIVVAGMEGALPSVVGGLVACPVVAVPTSIGYGAAFGGLTALFGMLTSCASGVTVVNIDNGFGAAVAVHRMLVGNRVGREDRRDP